MRRELEGGQIVGARHRVVIVGAGQKLTGLFVVDAGFEDGLADPLRETPMHLAGDDHRVDDSAEIVRGGEFDDFDAAGIGIAFDRSVPATVNWPFLNSTSASEASSRWAAILRPLAIILSIALTIALPPTANEREP